MSWEYELMLAGVAASISILYALRWYRRRQRTLATLYGPAFYFALKFPRREERP